MVRTLIILCCFISLFACNTQRDPCLLPIDVNLRVKCLRKLTDSSFADTILANMNFAAIKNDTLIYLYLGSKNVSNFFAKLSPKEDSSMYILQPDSTINSIDTIQFYYGRRLQFLSNACGYTYFFTLDSIHYTRHTLDTISIVNHDVTTDANTKPYEHVQIIF